MAAEVARKMVEKAGVDVEKVHAAVSGGAAGSWQLTNNGARVLKGDMTPGFKIKDYLKDLGIIMETAAVNKMPSLLVTLLNRALESPPTLLVLGM